MTDYAELQITTNFSFLRGASRPDELVGTAKAYGMRAVAVTDRNSLAGVVRAFEAAREHEIQLIVGARLDFTDHPSLLALPTDRAAYGRLSRLITLGRRRAPKGECHIARADLEPHGEGQILIALPPDEPDALFAAQLRALKARWGDAVYLAGHLLYRGQDEKRLAVLGRLAAATGVPLVATNDVHYHSPERRLLQDVVTCIREKCTIREAGYRLAANAERHMKPPDEMARLFRGHEEALMRTVEIAGRCRFSLDELAYQYPDEAPGDGRTPQQRLIDLTWEGAARRYPAGLPDKVRQAIAHELALVGELGYAPYFLTVHDIVRFAESRAILAQGRGSAANSAVCYCLGITAIDPARIDLLFERFISAERNEPPDIDVDFEHERREEVMQYVYEKYGRDRAAIAATVICYRARGAVRDVGKAMGLSADLVARLANSVWGWGEEGIDTTTARKLGLDPESRPLRQTLELARELLGFPRHLSQHVGGFVMTRGPLDTVVPIANAAMADRTFIEWDKDDLDTLKILKVDILALGMLTAVRKSFDLIRRHHGQDYTLASLPKEDPAVYDMLCKADSIGVFQVESRAQMSMLPRLRPREFYDLVIEVAIVRPGPIQGDMVHPYLKRRAGIEPVDYPSKALEQVLGKTLGVPLFQEQAMRIAIVAGGFTPAESDRLRRAMATFRRAGIIHEFEQKLIRGMVANGYERSFAERCFHQIEGFGSYGFPESHAASFALLVYVSAWIKCHHPAAFAAALLNSQPMGFYAPAQIVRDAAEHGVRIRPIDINRSDWDCTLEPDPDSTGAVALRLGLREIKGFRQAAAEALMEKRGAGYATPADLLRRARLTRSDLALLADADAYGSLALDRRGAGWDVAGLEPETLPLFAEKPRREPATELPRMALGDEVAEDYAVTGLSLKRHPMALLRPHLARDRVIPTEALSRTAPGRRVAVAGLVLVRQQPGSAKGTIFMTIEDETGIANLIVWPAVYELHRRAVLGGSLVTAIGRVQREELVVHLVVETLIDRGAVLKRLRTLDEGAAEMPPSRSAADLPEEFRRLSRDFR